MPLETLQKTKKKQQKLRILDFLQIFHEDETGKGKREHILCSMVVTLDTFHFEISMLNMFALANTTRKQRKSQKEKVERYRITKNRKS